MNLKQSPSSFPCPLIPLSRSPVPVGKCQITSLTSISAAAAVVATGSSNPAYVTSGERQVNSNGFHPQLAATAAAAPKCSSSNPPSAATNGELQPASKSASAAVSAAAVLESMFSNESSQLYRDYVNLPPPPPYPGSSEEQKLRQQQQQQQQQGCNSLLFI